MTITQKRVWISLIVIANITMTAALFTKGTISAALAVTSIACVVGSLCILL